MGSIEDTVTFLLTRAFPSASAAIAPIEYSDRGGGSIVWSGFSGMAQIDRQTQIWNVLRDELSDEDQLSVGIILTFTPEEIGAMQDIEA